VSVSNVAVKQRYIANGVTTSFAIPFAFIAGNGSASTKVYKISFDAEGKATETLQTEGALNDYTLSPVYNAGTGIDNSNVIFNTAPAVGLDILVIRSLPLTQLTSFLSTGPTFYKSIENVADILTFLIQQLDEKLQRAPKWRMSADYNNVPIPDIPTDGPRIWGINEDGDIEFYLPGDLEFAIAFNGYTKFAVPLNAVGQIMTGFSYDGTIYSSIIFEYEVQQGTTVFTNGSFQLQYLQDGSPNGTWQVVKRGEYDNGTPMGITFPIQQTLKVVQLLATETGVGDAIVKLKRMVFKQA
jgi:hypothetical protein